jgi:hypothetical protein
MITIDQMIERLQDLRAVAADGGETPVVVRDVANIYEQACAELMLVNVYVTNDDGIPVNWQNMPDGNTTQAVRVF